ncbi:bifunctional hydroxymethylpyrimidine kinase/phosphomethylpyrimidine kinase [Candidatus Thiosymbion oneisti]|uniref:bifunctional hydroxymethylpyrimidine kinase/phosphomethylpyrimidine kinase n=1 Tax=Candidatus Thiosymbion oneisti TaxID=589554 RepID=UPI000B1DCDDE|nr:hydroxymethylpyrimidine/phosphomethylpyrimidine kinase [Candidatus Thiosymbion oneisti]
MIPADLEPVLLCVGGHDPSGGAGIQADAEAARAVGVHTCSVISCLTDQDTCGGVRLWPQGPRMIEDQCRRVLADSRVGALKIGLLGSARTVRVLCELTTGHPQLPLILDPVLASGKGRWVADTALVNQLRNQLLGRCALVTPNLPEARILSSFKEPDDCAQGLLQTGCPWVLITGTHAPGDEVINRLYGHDDSRREWSWPRLQGTYHGSGCTLASAVAARIVRGLDPEDAVAEAQAYTWESLNRALRTGRCQLTPNRLFALDSPGPPQ